MKLNEKLIEEYLKKHMGEWKTSFEVVEESKASSEAISPADDLFDMDDAVRKVAKRCNIYLDDSSHDFQIEGLPWNLDFKICNWKAEENYDVVESISFNIIRYIGGSRTVEIEKNGEGITVKAFSHRTEKDPYIREMSASEWYNLLDNLFSDLKIQKGRRTFKLETGLMMDGEFWNLHIGLAGGRKRNWRGDNEYPPYWSRLKGLFDRFLLEADIEPFED